MNTRRTFLKQLATTAAGTVLTPYFANSAQRASAGISGVPVQGQMEVDWNEVRNHFHLKAGLNNLNNGVSPSLREALEKVHSGYEFCSEYPMENTPNYSLNSAQVADQLASLLGCSKDELALTHSTSEGLYTIIHGLDFSPGDEIIVSDREYDTAFEALDIRQSRHGVVIKTAKLPLPTDDDDAIVASIEREITPKTKLIVISHMEFRFGQILPLRKISELAHSNNIDVLVDGAHGFAHVDFKLSDLGCDYYAAPTHKWLCGPLGAGFLYIASQKIEKVWPHYATRNLGLNLKSIKKFRSFYTYGFVAQVASIPALDFHKKLGPKVREERLRFLRNYWAQRVSSLRNLKILTSLNTNQSCGIAAFRIDGVDSEALQKYLAEKHSIAVGSHDDPAISGLMQVRVAPNIYTSTSELDAFVDIVTEVSKRGIP